MEIFRFSLNNKKRVKLYNELLSASPKSFIQQTSKWASVLQHRGQYKPIFLIAERSGIPVGGIPLYIFKGPIGKIITSVPEPGPLGGVVVKAGEDVESIYAAILSAVDKLAIDLKCIACTIISNPFLSDAPLFEKYFLPDYVFENFTQVVDTQKIIIDGRWMLPPASGYRDVERNIAIARREGLVCTICKNPDEFDKWLVLHKARHEELGITPLPTSLLSTVFYNLCLEKNGFFQIVKLNNEIVAGCLFVHHLEFCDVFMLSMNRKYSKISPNYLLIQEAMHTMQTRQLRYLNWQSSPDRKSGVYKFKQKWGSSEQKYYFFTKLYCDVGTILSAGEETIRSGYPNNFVIPYGVFETSPIQKFHRKH